MSQWVTSKGECRILGWCQIVLRWSELPITTSARIYASSNSIPFDARLQLFSFLLQLSWLSFDLAIWAHFLKFLEKRGSMKIKWYWTDPATLSALSQGYYYVLLHSIYDFCNEHLLLDANNQRSQLRSKKHQRRQLVKTIDEANMVTTDSWDTKDRFRTHSDPPGEIVNLTIQKYGL